VIFLKHGELDYASFLGRIVFPTRPHNQWKKLVMNSQTTHKCLKYSKSKLCMRSVLLKTT